MEAEDIKTDCLGHPYVCSGCGHLELHHHVEGCNSCLAQEYLDKLFIDELHSGIEQLNQESLER